MSEALRGLYLTHWGWYRARAANARAARGNRKELNGREGGKDDDIPTEAFLLLGK